MGVMNRGVVYALWDYEPQSDDELGFGEGDCVTVLRRDDAVETEWWWARCGDREGYIPRNLLGVRVSAQSVVRPRRQLNARFLSFSAVSEDPAAAEEPGVNVTGPGLMLPVLTDE